MDAKPITEHNGIHLGDEVRIYGWRHPRSVDVRRVLSLYRAQCQGGMMMRLNLPLHNGSTCVSTEWATGTVPAP
jgi:hypothetical protein